MYVLNGNSRKILEAFRRMGLGDYEARAYFTLLVCGETSAWNVARKSGIPQPKIYHTLESLADREMVSVRDGMPKTYQCTPMKRLVRSYVSEKKGEIRKALKNEKWISEIVGAIAPAVKRHKYRLKVFKPRYRRG